MGHGRGTRGALLPTRSHGWLGMAGVSPVPVWGPERGQEGALAVPWHWEVIVYLWGTSLLPGLSGHCCQLS